jgi:peptide/nickel transport system ATP-binding protein
MIDDNALLHIKNLKVEYRLEDYILKAVDGVDIDIERGQCFGLVGESGSGKTTVIKAVLKLLSPNARVTEGTILLKGKDITKISEEEMDQLRWTEISFISQSAMNALNPVARISNEMVKTFMAHGHSSKKDIFERCEQLFEMVGLNKNRLKDFPHQFSGGMRQRAIIAMAIALNPSLIIADEPTTALDVIMQAQIMNLLKTLSEEKGISIFLITHDIAIIAELCDIVGVMYAGRLMEFGDIGKVFNHPHHPYTMGLKGAFPTIKELSKRLISIPGSPPKRIDVSSMCGFWERCPFAIEKCRNESPEMRAIDENHFAACHRTKQANMFQEKIESIFGAKLRS